MTTPKELLKQHYSKEQINQLKRGTGLKMAELGEILELDFIDEGDPAPDVEDMIEHIDYQSSLMCIASSCDSEAELATRWLEAF